MCLCSNICSYKITGKKKRLAFAQFAVFVAVAELAINMAATGFGTTSRVAYTEKQTDYENLLETAKKITKRQAADFTVWKIRNVRQRMMIHYMGMRPQRFFLP